MTTDLANATEYRRNAAECLEAIKRMSSPDDRARLLVMAEKWLDLANDAEFCYVRSNTAGLQIEDLAISHQMFGSRPGRRGVRDASGPENEAT